MINFPSVISVRLSDTCKIKGFIVNPKRKGILPKEGKRLTYSVLTHLPRIFHILLNIFLNFLK